MDEHLKRRIDKTARRAQRLKEVLSGSIQYKGTDYSCWCHSDCRVQGTYYLRPENEECTFKNKLLDAADKMVDTAKRAEYY